MALLSDILAWAQTDLHPWQSDAVRRLFQGHELTVVDYDELEALLKQSKGIVSDLATVVSEPLSDKHLPTVAPGGDVVVLESLGDVKNVNRLAPDQLLTFAPVGMTIVYGDNGAGKSGYSRVIKSACRARVKDEKVLPDARQHEVLHETPEAKFRVRIGAAPSDVTWREGMTSPPALATVAVLDTRCARAYTDQEGELIFVPWGLDVVDNLARVVFSELERRIRVQLDAIPTSDAAFDDLKGTRTVAGVLVRDLTHSTSDSAVSAQTTFTEADLGTLGVLKLALGEMSPTEKAKECRAISKRLELAGNRLANALAPIDDDAIARLAELDARALAAEQARGLVAQQFSAGEPLLAGTGDGLWKVMFDSARAFVEGHAHTIARGEPCPLCQSPMDEETAGRMGRFEAYIGTDVTAQAAALSRDRAALLTALRGSDVSLALDVTTVDYLNGRHPGWSTTAMAFEQSLSARRTWILEASNTHIWTGPPPLTETPGLLVESERLTLIAQAEALEATSDTKSREEMAKALAELQARWSLSSRKDALIELLANKRKHHLLSSCLADLKTKVISDKGRTLANDAVTDGLSKALVREFQALGVGNLSAALKPRNDQGRTKVKLVLSFPSIQKPESVLSEGEQRVIAIGSFLAELGVSGHRGAAVFDDPVSSLDHVRRQRVAKRLVAEAKDRQVVLFTHDSVFLAELCHEISEQNIPHAFRHLTYSAQLAGFIHDGLPWHHQPWADRIDKAEKEIREYAAREPTMDNLMLEATSRTIYSHLREITERVVEDVVFASVLRRYNDYVRVGNLRKVVGFEMAECDRLIALYDKVSDVISGHDKPSARGFVAPAATEAAADLKSLTDTIAAIKARRKSLGAV